MLCQLIYRPTNVPLSHTHHDEVVPWKISTGVPANLVGLTHMKNTRVPLYPGFLRRIFPMPRRSWVGMKAGARTLGEQRVGRNRTDASSGRTLCVWLQ